jgi:hypothetical protein
MGNPAGLPGFFRSKLMRSTLLVGGLATLAGYFALLIFIHGSKTAFVAVSPVITTSSSI